MSDAGFLKQFLFRLLARYQLLSTYHLHPLTYTVQSNILIRKLGEALEQYAQLEPDDGAWMREWISREVAKQL